MKKTSLEVKGEELLWDYMPNDPEHRDRRRTGFGTKTLKGLTLCILRIVKGAQEDDNKTEEA